MPYSLLLKDGKMMELAICRLAISKAVAEVF